MRTQSVVVRQPTIICNSSISVHIHSLHHLIQELVGIFQGYSMLLAMSGMRESSALTMIQLAQPLLQACKVKVALFARVESCP